MQREGMDGERLRIPAFEDEVRQEEPLGEAIRSSFRIIIYINIYIDYIKYIDYIMVYDILYIYTFIRRLAVSICFTHVYDGVMLFPSFLVRCKADGLRLQKLEVKVEKSQQTAHQVEFRKRIAERTRRTATVKTHMSYKSCWAREYR